MKTDRTFGIYSTRLHVILYIALLVATPFLLVQNFLQDAIQQFSRLQITFFGWDIRVVPTAAAFLCISLAIIFREYLTKIRLMGAIIAFAMIGLSQQIADFYLNHRFYDLQQNWHYFAYAIFAYMMYRDLKPRQASWTAIIRNTFFLALIASTFDEAFQLNMSSRVFDMSDIAKDVWGSLIGMVLICFWSEQPLFLTRENRKLRHKKIREYFSQPFSLLLILALTAFLFVIFSSLLTDAGYWYQIIAFTLCAAFGFFFLIHVSQFKLGKVCLVWIFFLMLLFQTGAFLKYRDKNIIHSDWGLTVYKGIPLIYFDYMIYPDGFVRPVDKKHHFNQGDRRFLLRQKTDILLIGSGMDGKGGKGFPQKDVSQFLYNQNTHRGTQVIILDTARACKVFNRLKQEKKNVLFVIHNTC